MPTLTETFRNIAAAIRGRTGKTATMTPAEMVTEISKLSDTSADTVTAAKMLSGTTAHDKAGNLIVGTNPYNVENIDPILTESLTALENKGVTLDGSEEIFDIPSLISTIEIDNGSGGGNEAELTGLLERTGTTLTVPDGCTRLGMRACSGYVPLEYVYLPDSITYFDENVFNGCVNLKLTSLPSKLTFIGRGAFNNCQNIELTSLPDGITEIGQHAFWQCSKFKTLILPAELKTIGSYAFENCTSLTTVTFKVKPDSVSTFAFTGCYNLTTINVPWAESEGRGEPWGASNATINYNYTEG